MSDETLAPDPDAPVASLEQLLKPSLPEDRYTMPSGFVVRVRALTRGEVFRIRKGGNSLPAEIAEQKILSKAMVEPAMTEADVKAWQDTCPAGELESLMQYIGELSGLEVSSVKEQVQEVH